MQTNPYTHVYNNNGEPIVTEINLSCSVDSSYFSQSQFFWWGSMATRISGEGQDFLSLKLAPIAPLPLPRSAETAIIATSPFSFSRTWRTAKRIVSMPCRMMWNACLDLCSRPHVTNMPHPGSLFLNITETFSERTICTVPCDTEKCDPAWLLVEVAGRWGQKKWKSVRWEK